MSVTPVPAPAPVIETEPTLIIQMVVLVLVTAQQVVNMSTLAHTIIAVALIALGALANQRFVKPITWNWFAQTVVAVLVALQVSSLPMGKTAHTVLDMIIVLFGMVLHRQLVTPFRRSAL